MQIFALFLLAWGGRALPKSPAPAMPAMEVPPLGSSAELAAQSSGLSSSRDVTFRDFIGANGMLGPSATQPLGLGWFRDCIGLGQVEPQKGKWDWANTDHRVQGAHAQNAEYLPCLLGTGWAGTSPKGFVPPKDPQDWADFVEQFVAHYSAPPFNLRYFEIWNEPTRQSGFWSGTDQQFVDLIYLPAAMAVRRHHCFVVLGGWPVSNSIQELDQVLNYHDAWQWTDIVNLHYRDVSNWQQLYNEWVKTGKCRGLWQTEVGFTPDPGSLPDVYLKSLYWALQAGWKDPGQYKLLWFSLWGAGADAEKCLLKTGPGGKYVTTAVGQRLAVMSDVLSGGSLAAFTGFQMEPPLRPVFGSKVPAALGFKVGASRTVIALLLDKGVFAASSSLPFSIGVTTIPKATELVTASGQRQALHGEFAGGTWHVSVPMQPVQNECGGCSFTAAYLRME